MSHADFTMRIVGRVIAPPGLDMPMENTEEQALLDRAVAWHERRFPNAKPELVTLKLTSEVGEVSDAVIAEVGLNSATGKGDVGGEIADVFIAAFVLLGRFFPQVDIHAEIDNKLTWLEESGY